MRIRRGQQNTTVAVLGLAGIVWLSTASAAEQEGQPPPAPAPAAQPTPPVTPPVPPGPPAAESLSLEEAVAFAVRNNPRVGEAAALIREFRGRQTQARAQRFPQAGVNNFIIRQGPVVPGFEPGANPAVPPWRWNYGVFVNQVVFDWGQRINAERAARENVTAARYRQGETENDIRLVVGSTFYNVLRAEELVAVAQERVESTTEQLRVARARFESDIAPRFDVIRSEAELAAAQQELIQAQNEVLLAEAAFNTTLGREVTTPVTLEPTEQPETPEPGLEALRQTAQEQRPALKALAAEIRAVERTIRSRRAENRPQIGFSAGYNRPNPGGFASTEYNYNAGLTMTFPFFDSGFTRGRVREAQGTRDALRQRLESQRLQVDLDIRQAQLDAAEARQRITAAEKEQTSAREALRVAEVRYRSGVGTNVEVTDAQVAVARAGQNLANAQFDYLTALVRLEYATGAPVAGLTGLTPGQGTNPGPPVPDRRPERSEPIPAGATEPADTRK